MHDLSARYMITILTWKCLHMTNDAHWLVMNSLKDTSHCNCKVTCSVFHYSDVMMMAMVSQIIGVSIVCSTVCSSADQRKHQSSESLAFVRGTHRWSIDFHHKGAVTRKCFHLMTSSCGIAFTLKQALAQTSHLNIIMFTGVSALTHSLWDQKNGKWHVSIIKCNFFILIIEYHLLCSRMSRWW